MAAPPSRGGTAQRQRRKRTAPMAEPLSACREIHRQDLVWASDSNGCKYITRKMVTQTALRQDQSQLRMPSARTRNGSHVVCPCLGRRLAATLTVDGPLPRLAVPPDYNSGPLKVAPTQSPRQVTGIGCRELLLVRSHIFFPFRIQHHMMWCWSYTEPHVTANPSVCTRWRHRLHTDRSVGFAPACVCNQSLQPVPKLHRTNQRRCPSIWARDSTATVPSRRRAASGICISQKRVRAFKKKEITQEPRTPGRGRPLGSACHADTTVVLRGKVGGCLTDLSQGCHEGNGWQWNRPTPWCVLIRRAPTRPAEGPLNQL